MHSFTESILEIHDLRNRLKESIVPPSDSVKQSPSSGPSSTTPKSSGTPCNKELDRQMSELRRRHSSIIEKKRSQETLDLNKPCKTEDEMLIEILDNDLSILQAFSFFARYLFSPVLVYEAHYPKYGALSDMTLDSESSIFFSSFRFHCLIFASLFFLEGFHFGLYTS